MARPNFFNENINRTFPFQMGTVGVNTPASGPVTMLQLPDSFIADCGFVLGAESGFVEGVHSIFLHKISRMSATRIDFEFHCDAPNLAETFLIFQRDISDPLYALEFAESDIPAPMIDSQSLSLSESIHVGECGEPYWSGYLVTGRLDQIAERLAVGQSIVRTSAQESLVEPALIQNLDQNQLISLNIANEDRGRHRPWYQNAHCTDRDWTFMTGGIYVWAECLQGDLKLRAGFSMTMNQNNDTNTIQLAAVLNAGQGLPCEQIPLFAHEAPPEHATNNLLDGDFNCNEVFRTINGLGGPSITLFAGAGVEITPDIENHRIVIDINLKDLLLCEYSTVSISF